MSAWSQIDCSPVNPVFTAVPWKLPDMWIAIIKTLVGIILKLHENWCRVSKLYIYYYQIQKEVTKIWIAPIQLHSLVMACFASLIAPFGGFFASGVKRAFNVKDFGQSIPGHGGMTDRMDCQFLMGFFASIYYQSFIKVRFALSQTYPRNN